MPHHSRQSNLTPRERWSLTLKRRRDARDPWPPIQPGQIWEIYRGEPDFAIAPLKIGDKLIVSSIVRRWEDYQSNSEFQRYPNWIDYVRYGTPGRLSEILFRKVAKPITPVDEEL